MVTVKYYDSPLGLIFLAADDTGLIGLWFEGQNHKRKVGSAEDQRRDFEPRRGVLL